MTDGFKPVMVSIGDRVVSWVMSISAVATLAFMGWLATTMIEVRTSIGHLNDQITNIRETRSDAVTIVVERLNYLSNRVQRLEDTVEGLRRSPEERRK